MWWEFAWAVVVLAVALTLLGGAIGYALGLRGLWLYATAPLAALPFVGGAAIIAPLAGVSWSVLPVVGLVLLVATALWLLRIRWGTRMGRRSGSLWIPLALAVGAILVTSQVVATIGSPTNFSQTFDNAFHLNVIRFILDTGNGSSLWVGHLTDHSGSAAFYPALWHDLVSLVAQLSGVEITVALNATTLVIAAMIWPSGIVLLTRQLFGANRVVLVASGVLSAAFPAFPLLLMDYGVLYPYQLGVALLPAALAITLRATGIGARDPETRSWQNWLLLVGVLPGVLLAHPGAFVAWMALSAPVGVAVGLRAWKRRRRPFARVAIVVAFAAYLVAGYVLLKFLRPASGRDWPTEYPAREAIGQVITGSVWYGTPAVLGVAAVVLGVIWVLVRRSRVGMVALGALLIGAFLYIVVTSLPYPGWRDLLTGSWYNNRPRLAALLPVAAVPLGAYGIGASWIWLRRRISRRGDRAFLGPRTRQAMGAFVLIVASVLTQTTGLSAVPPAVARASAGYEPTPSAPLIDADELALLERLGDEVPPDAVVVGSPWTGTALAYALAERRVVLPHMFTTTTPAEDEILNALSAATPDSAVCAAIEEVGVEYVLDFGTREVHGARNVFPGLTGLDESGAVELVDQEGHAKLYRVVAC